MQPTSELLQLRLDILGQVKYTISYEGIGVTVFMLLLARLGSRGNTQRETEPPHLLSSFFQDALLLHTVSYSG